MVGNHGLVYGSLADLFENFGFPQNGGTWRPFRPMGAKMVQFRKQFVSTVLDKRAVPVAFPEEDYNHPDAQLCASRYLDEHKDSFRSSSTGSLIYPDDAQKIRDTLAKIFVTQEKVYRRNQLHAQASKLAKAAAQEEDDTIAVDDSETGIGARRNSRARISQDNDEESDDSSWVKKPKRSKAKAKKPDRNFEKQHLPRNIQINLDAAYPLREVYGTSGSQFLFEENPDWPAEIEAFTIRFMHEHKVYKVGEAEVLHFVTALKKELKLAVSLPVGQESQIFNNAKDYLEEWIDIWEGCVLLIKDDGGDLRRHPELEKLLILRRAQYIAMVLNGRMEAAPEFQPAYPVHRPSGPNPNLKRDASNFQQNDSIKRPKLNQSTNPDEDKSKIDSADDMIDHINRAAAAGRSSMPPRQESNTYSSDAKNHRQSTGSIPTTSNTTGYDSQSGYASNANNQPLRSKTPTGPASMNRKHISEGARSGLSSSLSAKDTPLVSRPVQTGSKPSSSLNKPRPSSMQPAPLLYGPYGVPTHLPNVSQGTSSVEWPCSSSNTSESENRTATKVDTPNHTPSGATIIKAASREVNVRSEGGPDSQAKFKPVWARKKSTSQQKSVPSGPSTTSSNIPFITNSESNSSTSPVPRSASQILSTTTQAALPGLGAMNGSTSASAFAHTHPDVQTTSINKENRPPAVGRIIQSSSVSASAPPAPTGIQSLANETSGLVAAKQVNTTYSPLVAEANDLKLPKVDRRESAPAQNTRAEGEFEHGDVKPNISQFTVVSLFLVIERSAGELNTDEPLSEDDFRTASLSQIFALVSARRADPSAPIPRLTFTQWWGSKASFSIESGGTEEMWEKLKKDIRKNYIWQRGKKPGKKLFEVYISCEGEESDDED